MKTSELTGAALDWAVAKCEGETEYVQFSKLASSKNYYAPSRKWAQGGLIIEREYICIFVCNDTWPDYQRWIARPNTKDGDYELGPTPLIAAMRCFVAGKLGDEVEIPKELL